MKEASPSCLSGVELCVCNGSVHVLVVPVPGSSEVQRFGNCLPHLTAIEVERVPVGVWRQLPTAAAHAAALDQLPALLRHAARLKVVLDGAGQVAAGEGAVVTWGGGERIVQSLTEI